MDMIWTTYRIHSSLNFVVGFISLEEVEGLNPTRTTPNVWPMCISYQPDFSSLCSISTWFVASFLLISLWSIGVLNLDPRDIFPKIVGASHGSSGKLIKSLQNDLIKSWMDAKFKC